MDFQQLYYKVMIVCAIIITAVFSVKGFSQPLLNNHELVAEVHVPKECWSAEITKCSSARLTTSIFSGSLHDKIQTTVLYKLSGDVGKIGLQSWIKANKLFWVGWESVTTLSLDADHELYGAFNFSYGDGAFTFFPFASMHMKSETVGSVGFVAYLTKNFKLGWEYRYQSKNELSEMVVLAGMKLDEGVFEKIKKLIDGMFHEEQKPNHDPISNIANIH